MTSPPPPTHNNICRTHLTGIDKWRHHLAAHIMGTAPSSLPKWCAVLLRAMSIPYGLIVRTRTVWYRRGILPTRTLPCMVISVGNITVGGTGKTPLTLYLARMLHQLGWRVVILSRGYQGSAQKEGGVVSDGNTVRMASFSAGDEPLLMAHRLPGIPVIVGHDRYAAGMLALKRFHPDVVLLDDAYQHQRLKRDVNLVLMDGERPLGNGYLLPAGPLREPVSALDRADAIIFTRCGQAFSLHSQEALRLKDQTPVFESDHQPFLAGVIPSGSTLTQRHTKCLPPNHELESLRQSSVWGFAGIARNGVFLSTLASLTGKILGFSPFADHHPYSAKDLSIIGREAVASGARFIVTTEKDAVRLPVQSRLPLDLFILGIGIVFKPGSDFDTFIMEHLHRKKPLL